MKSSNGNFSYDDSTDAIYKDDSLGWLCDGLLKMLNRYGEVIYIDPSELRELADFIEQIQARDAEGAQS